MSWRNNCCNTTDTDTRTMYSSGKEHPCYRGGQFYHQTPASTPHPMGSSCTMGRSHRVTHHQRPLSWIFVLMILTLSLQSVGSASKKSKLKNVLLIIADDLRPQLDMYRDLDTGIVPFPRMYTPNINELASKSLVLGKAYCQVAICSPSRASFLTGRRPDTTKIHDSQTYWRDVGGDFTTMPQYFKSNGYVSLGMGKIFHPGRRASANDDPVSWSNDQFPYYHAESDVYWKQNGKRTSYRDVGTNFPYNLNDEEIANHAVNTLSELTKVTEAGKNFFMAVGFRLPHLPFIVPSQYLEYYPESEIKLPLNQGPPEGMPNPAWFSNTELKEYDDIRQLNWRSGDRAALPNTTTLNLRRYYYAAVTYVDNLVGKVLKQLDDLHLSEDTIVVFTSDHGYQLGEKGLWTKNTNFEVALQIPMIIHVPGLTRTMQVSNRIVELIDLFPTLVDLVGLPQLDMCPENATLTSRTKVCREGSSFKPLFDDPESLLCKKAAFSQIYRAPYGSMGKSIRNARYRYTEWLSYNKTTNEIHWDLPLLGAELYDYMTDPQEYDNKAESEDMDWKMIRQALSKALRAGWRSKYALPKADWPGEISSACILTSLSLRVYLSLFLIVLIALLPFDRFVGL